MMQKSSNPTANIYECNYFETFDGGSIHPGGIKLTERIIGICGLPAGARVVDAGCGLGVTVDYLHRVLRLDAIGIDVSAALIERARARYSGPAFFPAAAEELPFAAGTVDGILGECSFSIFRDMEQAFRECHRVLVPGGKLAITDIYARRSEGLETVRALAASTCLSGIRTREEWSHSVTQAGFSIQVWEDCSEAWRQWIARLIMQQGLLPVLWPAAVEHGSCQEFEQALKQVRPGYFLLVAEKNGGGLQDNE